MKKIILFAALTLSLNAGYSKNIIPNSTNLNISSQDGKVLITWVKSADDIAMYEVEKSEDGKNFKTIAYIITADEITNYSFKDKNSTNNIYYRLKQIDKVGQFSYTSIKFLKNNSQNEDVKIAATTNGKVYVQFKQQLKNNLIVRLTTLNGETIAEYDYSQPLKKILFNAPTNIKSFVVTVTSTNNLNISKQIVL